MRRREAFMRAIDQSSAQQLKTDSRAAAVDASPHEAFAPIRRIGCVTGWCFGGALWRLRGVIDRALGGPGWLRGGRLEPGASCRYPDDCVVGDTIDGRRVEPSEPDRLLRLSAGMKLPGRGWSKVRIEPLDGGRRSLIRQTATFNPTGIPGRLYRYAVLPLHQIVFPGLLRRLAQRATCGTSRPRTIAAAALAGAMTLQPATSSAQPPPAVQAVAFVDLDRYLGDWFEIARLPNRFQRQCLGDVRATYARRPDGRLDVVNRCRTAEGVTEARGVARVVDAQARAKLEVRFAPAWLSWLPVVWGDYWVIGLAPDYSWAVVGEPGRKYLWILARAPQLDAASIAAARSVVRDNGFDMERVVMTPQTHAQQ